jgi:hypothetical protein
MARGLRCVSGMHRCAKHHREVVAFLRCMRCGKETAGPGPLAGMAEGVGASLRRVSLTWARALGWRLRRQLLDPAGTGAVADVVGRLGAVPAWPDAAAELAIGPAQRRGRAAKGLGARNRHSVALWGARRRWVYGKNLSIQRRTGPLNRAFCQPRRRTKSRLV